MATETQPSTRPLREAAAAVVTPDPVTASLLAKHSAGEKLSQSEYGKLGAFAAKAKGWFTGKRDAPGGPGSAGTGNAPAVGAVASDQTPGSGVAPVPVAPGVAERTTKVVLRRCDALKVRWIERHARAAGAEGPKLDRFRAAAALSPDDHQLLAELSPDIFAELGIDVRKYPLAVAGCVLGTHATELWLLVQDLKDIRKERDKETSERLMREDREAREARKAQPPTPVTQPGLMGSLATAEQPMQPMPIPPERPQPPGAPPKVT